MSDWPDDLPNTFPSHIYASDIRASVAEEVNRRESVRQLNLLPSPRVPEPEFRELARGDFLQPGDELKLGIGYCQWTNIDWLPGLRFRRPITRRVPLPF